MNIYTFQNSNHHVWGPCIHVKKKSILVPCFSSKCLPPLANPLGGHSPMTGPKPDPLAVLATDAEMASWAGAGSGGMRMRMKMDGMAGTEKNH